MPIGSPISSISLRSVFCSETIRDSEAIVCLAAQPDESDVATRHREQTGRPLVVCFTVRRRSRVSGESTVELRGLLLGATLRREPVGTVREVMFSILWGHDVVNALASQGGRTGSDR